MRQCYRYWESLNKLLTSSEYSYGSKLVLLVKKRSFKSPDCSSGLGLYTREEAEFSAQKLIFGSKRVRSKSP